MNKIIKKIITTAGALAVVVGGGVCLTACGNKSTDDGDRTEINQPTAAAWDAYKDRLTKVNYTVRVLTDKAEIATALEMENADNIDWVLGANKGDEAMVQVIKFNSEAVAKTYEAAVKAGGMTAVRDGEVLFMGDQTSVEVAYGEAIPEPVQATVDTYQNRLVQANYTTSVAATAEEISGYLTSDEGKVYAETYNFTANDVEWMMNVTDEDDASAAKLIKFTTEAKAIEVEMMYNAANNPGAVHLASTKTVVVRDGQVIMIGQETVLDTASTTAEWEDYEGRLEKAGCTVEIRYQAEIVEMVDGQGGYGAALGCTAADIEWMAVAFKDGEFMLNLIKLNTADKAITVADNLKEMLKNEAEGKAYARDGQIIITGDEAAVAVAVGDATEIPDVVPEETTETTMAEYQARLAGIVGESNVTACIDAVQGK